MNTSEGAQLPGVTHNKGVAIQGRYVSDPGTTEYIRGVLDATGSIKNSDGYILDFWRMVIEELCREVDHLRAQASTLSRESTTTTAEPSPKSSDGGRG